MKPGSTAPGSGAPGGSPPGGAEPVKPDLGGDPTRTQLSAVAWVPVGDLAYDDWLRHGWRLGVAGRNVSWWIGDWLRYGGARYGQKYELAARVTSYDRQTLMNMVYVAARFGEISRRREKLSWSHHAELAALDEEEQDWWLDCALASRLSVRDLRRELGSSRQGREMGPAPASILDGGSSWEEAPAAHTAGPPARDVGHGYVTCPECGHEFAVSGRKPKLTGRQATPAPV